jgi:hypothetical protein
MSARHHHENVMEAISPVLSIFYWPGLLLSLFFCGYWIWHLPSAGIAVGALGAVGVFVALKGEKIREGHRVIWALITVVFLFTEVRAIKDQEEKHAQTMKQIVDSYKEAKTENQTHFDTTFEKLDTHTSRLEALSRSQETIAKLSNENLLQITGSKGQCYISPVLDENGSGLPLVVLGSKYPMYDVVVNVFEQSMAWDSPEIMMRRARNPLLVLNLGNVSGQYAPLLVLNLGNVSGQYAPLLVLNLGNVSGQYARHIGYNLPVQRGKNNRFQINIYSRAASFTEFLVVTWNKGHWNIGIDLARNGTNKWIMKVPKDFPYLKEP